MPAASRRIPLPVKVVYTAFVVVLVPYYWQTYGPTNFFYFCDVALLMTLPALWREDALLASAAGVGIILPQVFWQLDFLAQLCGFETFGLTAYMFDPQFSLFARFLSFFHFWLPLLLIWTISRLGYDPRGLPLWTALSVVLILISYFALPAPPAPPSDPLLPVNVNYVYGLSNDAPQPWMPPQLYVVLLMLGLPLLVYYPTHRLLMKFFPTRPECGGNGPGDRARSCQA